MNRDELQDLVGMYRVAVLNRLAGKIEELIAEHAAAIPDAFNAPLIFADEVFGRWAEALPLIRCDAEPGDQVAAPMPDFPEDLFGDDEMKTFVEDQFAAIEKGGKA